MKDLNILWKRYQKSNAKCETDGNARNANPQQLAATTRAFKVFYKELKEQRGYNDIEATNSIIQEWS